MKNDKKIAKGFFVILMVGILLVGLFSACSKTDSAESDYNWREPLTRWKEIEA